MSSGFLIPRPVLSSEWPEPFQPCLRKYDSAFIWRWVRSRVKESWGGRAHEILVGRGLAPDFGR